MILFFSGHEDAIHQYVKIMQHHAVCNHYKWIYHLLFTIFHPFTYILIRKRNNKVIFLSFLLGLSVPYVDFTSFYVLLCISFIKTCFYTFHFPIYRSFLFFWNTFFFFWNTRSFLFYLCIFVYFYTKCLH